MKNKLFAVLVCLTIAAMPFLACRKNVDANSNEAVYMPQVNSWIDTKVVSNASGKAYAGELKKSLDYANMHVETSADGEKIAIIPMLKSFLDSRNAGVGQAGSLVARINKAGQLWSLNIALFKPDDGQAAGPLPENTFYNIYNTSKVKANGTFNFFDVNGRLQFQLGYKGGRMVSEGTVQAKSNEQYVAFKQQAGQIGTQNPPASVSGNMVKTNGVRVNNEVICLFTFLITNYYDYDGNYLMSSWQLTGFTCPEEWQVPQPENGGGITFHGPDGSTWNGAAQYNYAVTREWIWTVYSLPYGQVISTETIAGIKANGYPEGGYFTGATHTSSYNGDGTHSWNEISWGHSVSMNLIYIYLSGGISGPTVNTTISETGTFTFSALFP